MIYLREVSMNDSKRLYEICKNPLVTEYLSWYPHESIEETKFVIEHIYLNKEKDNLPNNYVICLSENDLVIGIIDFFKDTQPVEVGYFLDPEYWNKGIMTKALMILLDKGFNEFKLNEIYIRHLSENKGSESVIVKNGFKFIKEELKHYNKFDKMIKSYKLTRSDYDEKQSKRNI